jgi:diacylglycerol kinase family enzyme
LGNVTHVSKDTKSTPRAQINDGNVDLVMMKGNNSGVCSMVNHLINNLDEGNYFDKTTGEVTPSSGVDYLKIKAFRLFPKTNLEEEINLNNYPNFPTVFSIDGEAYPIEPVQGRVINKAIKFFCLDGSQIKSSKID